MALRIEDVEPSDAFAYELSTRQWIDAFRGWDKSIDSLVSRIGQLSGAEPVTAVHAVPPRRRSALSSQRPIATAAFALMLLTVAAGGWWWLRPAPAAAHSMAVRLAGFQLLSADLPPTIRDTVDAEIAAAFNADGVVGVSIREQPRRQAHSACLCIGRDNPARRTDNPCHHPPDERALWRDAVDRQLQL